MTHTHYAHVEPAMVIRAFPFFGSRKIGAGLDQIGRDNRPSVSQSGARCAPKSRRSGQPQPIMAHQSAPSMKWLSFIHRCTLPASWSVTELIVFLQKLYDWAPLSSLPCRIIEPGLERNYPGPALSSFVSGYFHNILR
jgi:hypothetical protein